MDLPESDNRVLQRSTEDSILIRIEKASGRMFELSIMQKS